MDISTRKGGTAFYIFYSKKKFILELMLGNIFYLSFLILIVMTCKNFNEISHDHFRRRKNSKTRRVTREVTRIRWASAKAVKAKAVTSVQRAEALRLDKGIDKKKNITCFGCGRAML